MDKKPFESTSHHRVSSHHDRVSMVTVTDPFGASKTYEVVDFVFVGIDEEGEGMYIETIVTDPKHADMLYSGVRKGLTNALLEWVKRTFK
jgi:hypothetical protein